MGSNSRICNQIFKLRSINVYAKSQDQLWEQPFWQSPRRQLMFHLLPGLPQVCLFFAIKPRQQEKKPKSCHQKLYSPYHLLRNNQSGRIIEGLTWKSFKGGKARTCHAGKLRCWGSPSLHPSLSLPLSFSYEALHLWCDAEAHSASVRSSESDWVTFFERKHPWGRKKKKVLAPPRLRNNPLFLALLAVKKKKKKWKVLPGAVGWL